MDALLVQDWVTIRGVAGITVAQTETGWVDLGPYQDIVVWLHGQEASGLGMSLNYQTSPTKDDSLFFTMGFVNDLSSGIVVTSLLKETIPPGSPPIGKWFRWQLAPAPGAWDMTFRLYLAANRIGRRFAISEAASLGDLEGVGLGTIDYWKNRGDGGDQRYRRSQTGGGPYGPSGGGYPGPFPQTNLDPSQEDQNVTPSQSHLPSPHKQQSGSKPDNPPGSGGSLNPFQLNQVDPTKLQSVWRSKRSL